MAVAVVRDDGICIRANHTLCRLSGYDMVELAGPADPYPAGR